MKITAGIEVRELYLNLHKESTFEPWVTSEEERKPIRLGLYQTAEEYDYKNICFGDAVWIFHLETGSFVKSVETDYNFDPFLFGNIRNVIGQLENEIREPKKNETKILLQKTENELSAEKFGLWQILYASSKDEALRKWHPDSFKGGKVRFDHEVRFFNIRHKNYLCVEKKKDR